MANIEARVNQYSEVVVYDKATNEVIASIPLNGDGEAILKDGVTFRLYNRDTEPVYMDDGEKLVLNERAMVYKKL